MPQIAPPITSAPERGKVLNLAEHRAAQCALDIVSEHCRIGIKDLRAPNRGRAPIARARQLAAYLCCVGAGLTLSAAGRAMGRDRTTIAHACRLIEDLRDNPLRPRFERAVQAMEAELHRRLSGKASLQAARA